MTIILFTGASCSINRGSAAMVISTSTTLKKYIPNANFILYSSTPLLDQKNCSKYCIKVSDGSHRKVNFLSPIFSILYRLFRKDIFLHTTLLREYKNADIVIDLTGDTFSDDTSLISSVGTSLYIIMCKLLNKPIMMYAQSIGPFKTVFTRLLAKFALNRADLVIVREEITEKYLKKIGVTQQIYLSADSAFLLSQAPIERVNEILLKEDIPIGNCPLIGISASQHIDSQFKGKSLDSNNEYRQIMAQLIDYMIENLHVKVLFVPHVSFPDRGYDDKFVGKKIFDLINNKDNVFQIKGEYSPEELKGIISQCDLFIGARMHANIAALSSCVPTVAISYSIKTPGIMKMAGQEKYVCDFKAMTFEELKSKVDDAWENREKIRNALKTEVKVLQEKASYNAKLVKELIDSLNK